MGFNKRRFLVFVIVLCVIPLSVRGDEIITKDGRQYEGTIISESKKEVVIRIGSRELTIAAQDIEKITYRELPGVKPAALDVDLLEQFYARSLSITSGARGAGYGSGSSSGVGFVSSSWVVWKGYYGFEKVKEEDFFRIAGRDDLTEKAVKHRRKAATWAICGAVGVGGGLGLLFAGMGEDVSPPLIISGAVVTNIGFWSGTLFGLLRLFKNGVDINTASGVSRIYNEKLLRELNIETPLSEIKPQF